MISVIIPAFNAAKVISETVRSISNQSYKDIEVIVVDDGSSDKTAEIALSHGGQDIYCFKEPNNFGGPSRPRNIGLKKSHGELISLFDADDIMLPDKLQRAFEIFTRYPDADILFTDFNTIDSRGQVKSKRFLDNYQEFRNILKPLGEKDLFALNPDKVFEELAKCNFIGTSSVVVRRRILEEAGGFDESLKNADDIDMWYRLARTRKQFLFLDFPYHQYRKSSTSISNIRQGKRLYHVCKMLEKNTITANNSGVAKLLNIKLRHAQLAHAWALQQEGSFKASRIQYLQVLKQQITWTALRGLFMTVLKPVWYRVASFFNKESDS